MRRGNVMTPGHSHHSIRDVFASSGLAPRARDPFRAQPQGASGVEAVLVFSEATMSPLRRICRSRPDSYVGFSGAVVELFVLCQEALEMAQRRQSAEVDNTRYRNGGLPLVAGVVVSIWSWK